MCRYYHIPYYIYRNRVKSGWMQGKALTGNLYNRNGESGNYRSSVVDHLGNLFRSITEIDRLEDLLKNTDSPYDLQIKGRLNAIIEVKNDLLGRLEEVI
jgi:hypothetical protein